MQVALTSKCSMQHAAAFRCCAVNAARCHGPCAVSGFRSPCWRAGDVACKSLSHRSAACSMPQLSGAAPSTPRGATGLVLSLGLGRRAGTQEMLHASRSHIEVQHAACRSFSGAAPSTPRGATGLVLSLGFGRRAGAQEMLHASRSHIEVQHAACRSFSGAAPSTPRGATGLVLSLGFGHRAVAQEMLHASHSRTEVQHAACPSFSGAAPSTPRGKMGFVQCPGLGQKLCISTGFREDRGFSFLFC